MRPNDNILPNSYETSEQGLGNELIAHKIVSKHATQVRIQQCLYRQRVHFQNLKSKTIKCSTS